ncbi:MAG TPA: S1 RNA-binding domain-containing protein, partial [Puia sp.]|nr:S1 RNA-binding domain-containing protein [Puia sp.]
MSENNIVNPNAELQEPIAVEEATATSKTPAEVLPEQPAGAHDDFDWTIDKRNVAAYTQEEKEKYDKVYDNTFVSLTDGELVKGLVVGLTKTDVVVNIGFKSDGLVSLNEFRDIVNLKTGDEVEVMVVEKEDREGHLHL